MRRRCENPSQHSYRFYGARGIKVCERWLTFENFLQDMGECTAGMTLDRIDPNGNYEPANCRWLPGSEQQLNRRSNHLLTYNGRTMPLVLWAKEFGLKAKTLRARICDHGMSIERALTMPVLSATECAALACAVRYGKPVTNSGTSGAGV